MSQLQLLTCDACGGLLPASRTICLHCDAPISARSRWGRLGQLLAGGGFLMTLAACYGAPYRHQAVHAQQPYDTDGDGAQLGPDCDDTDPRRYPGAVDPAPDGIDQDCDGVDGTANHAVIAEPPR